MVFDSEVKMNKTFRNVFLCCSLGFGAALSGCGGSGSLGLNSEFLLILIADSVSDIQDLELIISPDQGGPNDPEACTDTVDNFGCVQRLLNRTTEIEFTSNSGASSSPFYVYVRNLANANRNFELDVEVDGDRKFVVRDTVFPNEDFRVLAVRRNSAEDIRNTLRAE